MTEYRIDDELRKQISSAWYMRGFLRREELASPGSTWSVSRLNEVIDRAEAEFSAEWEAEYRHEDW